MDPFMSMGPQGMMPGSMGAMNPSMMAPGMMPGSMGGMMGGMMPGQMAPFGMTPMGMNRSGIMSEELPNQRLLDERLLPMVPTPWQGAPMPLMPGQATGMGVNNLHPLQQQQDSPMTRLPNAYRMYGYGNREITWAKPVPVPEPNTGVMINAEFPMPRHMEGREVFDHDYGIRNSTWTYQGPWVQPYDPIHDRPDWKHKMFGSYEQAVDIKRPRHHQYAMDDYYRNLASQRDHKGVFDPQGHARKKMTIDVMDDQELAAFWANPEKVMNERLA